MENEEKYRQAIDTMRRGSRRLDHEGDCWTEEEKKCLKKLFDKCIGITELACILQRTEPAVYQQIGKMDLFFNYADVAPVRRRRCRKGPRCRCAGCMMPEECCPHCVPMDER